MRTFLKRLPIPPRTVDRARLILLGYGTLQSGVLALTALQTSAGTAWTSAALLATLAIVAGFLVDYRRGFTRPWGVLYELPALVIAGIVAGPGLVLPVVFGCLYLRAVDASLRGSVALATSYFAAHAIMGRTSLVHSDFAHFGDSLKVAPLFGLSAVGIWALATALRGACGSTEREQFLRTASEDLARSKSTAETAEIVEKAAERMIRETWAVVALLEDGTPESAADRRRAHTLHLTLPTQSPTGWTLSVTAEAPLQPLTVSSLEALAASAAITVDRHSSDYRLEQRIEELRYAEQFVTVLHQRNEAILNSVSEGVVGIDGSGRVIFANAAASAHLGHEPGETQGALAYGLLRPVSTDDGTVIDEVWWKVTETLTTGDGYSASDESFTHDDGTPFPVDYTVTSVSEAGVMNGAVVTFRDITKRRQTERRLHQFAALVESSEDAIIGTAPDGVIQSWNPGAVKLLKRTPAEAIGMQLLDLFDDPAHADLLRPATGGESIQTELSALRSDGGHIDVSASVAPIRDANGTVAGLSAIVRDITERRQIEEAERANRAKSEFLSRMSHELRTPLNAILGFGQLLAMQGLDPGQGEKVDQILKAGDHLLNLINEVLEISRIEAGKMSISIEPVCVQTLVESVIDLVSPLSFEREITIDVDHDALATYVAADQQRLKQILLNLLSNAIKYNRPQGRVSVGCSIDDDGRVAIGVTDTGIGISAAMMKRLFRPFDRLGADSGDVEGSGLGLALSKGLADVMDGTLSVESEEGAGSTWTITLPQASAPDAGSSSAKDDVSAYFDAIAEADELIAQRSPTSARILCIEDNVSNLKLVEQIFASRPGIELLSAVQGTLGYELARQHVPDLILLDINLPDTTGDIVLDKLRADDLTRHIPVIVLSADATATQIEKLLAKGAHQYLTKPLDVRRLLDAVDGILPITCLLTKD